GDLGLEGVALLLQPGEVGLQRCDLHLEIALRLDPALAVEGVVGEIADHAGREQPEREVEQSRAEAVARDHALRVAPDRCGFESHFTKIPTWLTGAKRDRRKR